MNCLHKNQQIIFTFKIFFTSLNVRCQYFHDKKNNTNKKNKKLVNLASLMVEKYLFFDNLLLRNSETECPISGFQLKISYFNNVCS